jgi:hypothetical protein
VQDRKFDGATSRDGRNGLVKKFVIKTVLSAKLLNYTGFSSPVNALMLIMRIDSITYSVTERLITDETYALCMVRLLKYFHAIHLYEPGKLLVSSEGKVRKAGYFRVAPTMSP